MAIETAANVNTDVFSRFIREVDFVFMDLKHYDSEQHKAGTGVGNEQIIENMKHLSKSGIPYTVRIPVIPDFNDSKDDAHAFGTLFRNLNIKQVELLPFHQMGELKYANLGKKYTLSGIPGLHPEDLKPFAKILETYIDHVQIGG